MISGNVEFGERVAATRQVELADVTGNLECAKNVIVRKINLLDVALKPLVNGKEHQVLKTRGVDGIDSTLKALDLKGIELGADAQIEVLGRHVAKLEHLECLELAKVRTLGAQGIDAERIELVQLANGREIRHLVGHDQPRDALSLLGGQLAIVIVIVVGKQPVQGIIRDRINIDEAFFFLGLGARGVS